MGLRFIPPVGYEFRRDGQNYVVARVNEVAVFFRKVYDDGRRSALLCEGIDYWNSNQQVVRMATEKELGYR